MWAPVGWRCRTVARRQGIHFSGPTSIGVPVDEAGRFSFTAPPGTYDVDGGCAITPGQVVIPSTGAELSLEVADRDAARPDVVVRVTRLGVPIVGVDFMVDGKPQIYSLQPRELGEGLYDLFYKPGTHHVEAVSRELRMFGATDVTVGCGRPREVAIELDQASAVGGVVLDQDGRPVPEPIVRIFSAALNDGAVVHGRPDGSFYAAPPAPGVYHAQVFAADARPLRLLEDRELLVTRADTIVSDVELVVETRRASLSGRVEDEHGAAVPGAFVLLGEHREPIVCESWAAAELRRAGPDGRFTIADIPLGDVVLTAIGCDGRRAELRDVAVGRDDVVIRVSPP